ncbi:putative dehydrogenase [Microbacterium sp. W4I4]|uniref:Gfo/Idh/MocA family oxidoreductase n=1 Tax=Microbacterium sp. W4I4 TaxID=3042295 RepID=UPI00278273A2|nr:Gfo/Idh/MocA family oxidoreductase [Microbacterium sp. W4I4]MDQ0614489.1 putative dehydrogenase [Microbacterium sp. W4I4]
MTVKPLRVAFAGLAHSHPSTDAANALEHGAEVVAVHDADAAAAADFAARFGGAATDSIEELLESRPDVVIATPRPHETVPLLRALADAAVPVFFNKVVAATGAQLHAWEEALAGASASVGTASVLRFAPGLEQLAVGLAGTQIIGLRVHAQHANAGFQVPGRSWQDDPAAGGGTLVTVGVHAWEMIDRILPGATFQPVSGWTSRLDGSTTRSEDAAGVEGLLTAPDGRTIPVQVLVSGVPGPDRYAIEAVTASGVHSLELDVGDAIDALGFAGLMRALLRDAPHGRVPAHWREARTVVVNSIRAAESARGAGDQV